MLPKGQVGKCWESSNKGYWGALERKYLYYSLQEVNKNDDMFTVIQTYGTLAANQICSENGRWYHMCMAGNGIEIQYLKLKLTVDDPLCHAIICSFSTHKDTHKRSQVAMGGLNGMMNVCLNIHISG